MRFLPWTPLLTVFLAGQGVVSQIQLDVSDPSKLPAISYLLSLFWLPCRKSRSH